MKRLISLSDHLPFPYQVEWRWKKYANGELYVELPDLVDGDECVLLFDFTSSYEDWFGLGLLAHTLARNGGLVSLATPYFPYARQDKPEPGRCLGLQWFTDYWQTCGIKEIIVLQLHNIRFDSGPGNALALPIISLSCARPLAQKILDDSQLFDWVVAPDVGAENLAREVAILLPNHPAVLVMTKTRDRQSVRHKYSDGLVGGRVLIVDDIFDTGSTILSCLSALRPTADSISAAVVHGVFSQPDWPRIWEAGLEHMWFSDSRPLPPQPVDPRWRTYSVLPILKEYFSP